MPVLGLLPARMSEISNPRLNAWLNISLVWNVEANGNHDEKAIGIKIMIPIAASYKRAIDLIDFHNPIFFTTGFQAQAICRNKKKGNMHGLSWHEKEKSHHIQIDLLSTFPARAPNQGERVNTPELVKNWTRSFNSQHNQKRELTERIPHPVGRKAKIQANMSLMERGVIATATATPASANKNASPWTNRSTNWKLTDIFWLKVNTCGVHA